MTPPRYVSLNGKIVPYADARIHVMTPAVRYAFNVFEGLRGYWNEARREMYVFRLGEHLDRLERSMRFMRYEQIFGHRQLADAFLELIRANEFREDIHALMMAYIDGDGEMTASGPIGLAIVALAGRRNLALDDGLACQVSAWQRNADNANPPRIKSVSNYNNARLGWWQAKADGYDSTIFLTPAGKVSEGPGACVFLVRDGAPITPSITSNILESITRATILELLRGDLGQPAREREVDRSELYAASEAFFCGTRIEVAPITRIDRLAVGDGRPGPLTRAVKERYLALARGATDERPEWRTPVWRA